MSLQVWLPLTKDLRNQGLDNVTVTNNGATFNSTGKLGGCYSFDGSNDNFTYTPNVDGLETFSIALWLCPTASTPVGAFFSLERDTYWQVTFNGTNVEIRDNSIGWNGARKNYSSGTYAANVWTHLVVTYNKGILKIYRDGNLLSTNTVGGTKLNTGINNARVGSAVQAGYYYAGKINDVRFYDHCLSPMEVKELSKGLVLHYPLNRRGFGKNNILINTHFDSRYSQTNGWNTTKNGTLMASSWGGYNSGVGNQASVYHAHLKKFNEEYVYEYIKTADEGWLGISQSGLQSKLVSGKTYTFSWEEYHVNGANKVGTGLYYYKSGASSANFHLGIQQPGDPTFVNKWKKYSYTFTAPSDADYSKSMSWYVYGHYGGNGTFYVRRIKLEEGSVATPWSPASDDALYTTLGLNGTTEYDISGFQNNGTRNGSFDWDSNKPKYNCSMAFNGSNNSVQTPNLTTMVTDKNYTIACWFYKDSIGSKGYQTIYGGPSGFELEARNGSGSDPQLVGWNWGKPIASYTFGVWHHFAFVHTDSDCKIYLDGEYVSTGSSVSIPSGNYFIGSWRDTSSQNYEGKISDFRIYATALSAFDIRSLYQNN